MNPAGNYKYMVHEMQYRYEEGASCAVGILFANPRKAFVREEILENIEYANERSGLYIDFFFAGYSKYETDDPNEVHVNAPKGKKWYYSARMFREFIETLEKLSTWQYHGETVLLLTEFRERKLHFDRVISIWLDRAVREESIYSVSTLFEDIFRIARAKTEAHEFRNKLVQKSAGRSVLDSVCSFIDDHTGNLLKATKIYAVRNYTKKE